MAKELRNNFLIVHILNNAKSLRQDQYLQKKKSRMGDVMMEMDGMQEYKGAESRVNDFNGYIEGLTLCLLACSIVGTVPPAIALMNAETEASDPTDYVQVPYCLILRYLHRLTTSAAKVPGNRGFECAKQRDAEERTI